MNSNRILPIDENESISDSLIRAIRIHDAEIKSIALTNGIGIAAHNIFRQFKDNEGISALRKIITDGYLFGFLEAGDALAKKIKEIVEARKIRAPDGGDPLTKKIFDYLDSRLQYHEQKQKRLPAALTNDYKVLLVGDGWVIRSDPENPAVKRAAESLQSNNVQDKIEGEILTGALNLKNRGYAPDQVFTVDHTAAQLPDLTSDVIEIKNYLPEKKFDFIYFEGLIFETSTDTQAALNAVFPSLKSDGLILFHTEKNEIKLMSKAGEIKQSQLDRIPKCVRDSINNRQLTTRGYQPLEDARPTTENFLILTDQKRLIHNLNIKLS